MNTKRFVKVLASLLVLVMVVATFAACQTPTTGGTETTAPSTGPVTQVTYKQAEYNTYTAVMPSNWNEMTYADGNDTQILSYIGSSFFDYDYKFENDVKYLADGSINKDAIVEGGFTTNYSAATKLEDVTSSVDAKWGYTEAQKTEGGYAWKITLRDDLKWDDGTVITAADFVYSMKAQLDPTFMNFRANSYYDTLKLKGAREYFFQDQAGTYESLKSQGFSSSAAAVAAGKTLYVKPSNLFSGIDTFVDKDGVAMPEWIAVDDTVYADPDDWKAGANVAAENGLTGKWIVDTYGAAYLEPGKSYESSLTVFVENKVREWSWENVGIYAVEGENAFVVCLDLNFKFLKDDGSLSYLAAYYMSSLPLVHKTKYEANVVAPAEGATLYTSKYNSSLESTASWGPYKLVEFEAGSHYKLAKNEYWYGWNMEQYKNQYNITAINCRKVEEASTQWMGFLNGTFDDGALTTDNYADYGDSKYVSFTTTSTGTYGMQLYSNLSVLKQSANNNGILAIKDFRLAFNLALNRSDVIEKIWPGSAAPCFGLLSVGYYYDVENSATLSDGGIYRHSEIAKKGILRAYGFVEADGKWSQGDLTNLTLDEAYESLTGYNPVLAKQKFAAAVAELTANAEYYGYDATKDVTLVYGSSADTAKQRFRAEYIQTLLNDLSAGTALEGKIKVVFDASAGSKWADAFRSGATQIGFGYGFQGNAFNPFDIVGAFVDKSDSLNYHMYWDTANIDLTIAMPAGNYEGAGQTITMSVENWFFCLNGLAAEKNAAKKYNWGAGFAPNEARLTILSALEELVIGESRSVMLISDSGGSLLGAKFSQFSKNENTFMGFGGIRYMVVNYTDAEWAAFVAANNNDLSAEYKKSE